MPAGDKTGPEGKGAMTGRGAGYCAGYDQPGYTNDEIDPGQQMLGRRLAGRRRLFGGRGRRRRGRW